MEFILLFRHHGEIYTLYLLILLTTFSYHQNSFGEVDVIATKCILLFLHVNTDYFEFCDNNNNNNKRIIIIVIIMETSIYLSYET